MRSLKIATRESPLALWQAEFVAAELKRIHPGLPVELLGMTTRADQWLQIPLAKVGGKGLFVKELEEAMLRGEADLAVHSMKDVPMELPQGLSLEIICEREDPRDAFVSNHYASFEDLPQRARLGTSSLRRQSQLLAVRPDLEVIPLRGNVNTRLRKLDEGEFDAIVLAAAGLLRLEMANRIAQYIPVETSLPAGGQGAVGIEIRSDDEELRALLKPLHHDATAACVLAERAMNRRLNGSCQVPIACHAKLDGEVLTLEGLVADISGEPVLRASATAAPADAEALGIEVAESLLAQGAGPILAKVHEQQ